MNSTRFFGALGGRTRFLVFTRRFLYSVALLLVFMAMSGGFFKKWQPVLIVPLAVAVAMREGETFGALFGAVCGLFLDVAEGKLFGFSAIWIMPCCLAAALLVAHLIKVNLINFIWVGAFTSALVAATDYFFGYVLWGLDNSAYVLTGFIIPSCLSSVILSPLMYFSVKNISVKFSPREAYGVSASDASDPEYDYGE